MAFSLDISALPPAPRISARKPKCRDFEQQLDYTKVCFAYDFGRPPETLV